MRRFLTIYDVGLTRLKDLNFEEITRLILVDTQEPERLGPLQPLCMNPAVVIHIYDHHPAAVDASQGTCHADFKVVESVGATTTVLIERVLQQGLPLSSLEATTLALGLYDETGSFTYVSTTPRDLQAAAAVLHAGADLTVVADILRQPLEPDTIALLNDVPRQHSTTYYLEGSTVLLATSHQEHYHWSWQRWCRGSPNSRGLMRSSPRSPWTTTLPLSGRSRRPHIDVAQIAAAFGGGGHPGAAAATVKDRTMVEVRETLEHLLTAHYRPTLLAKDVMTTPVHTMAEDAIIAEMAHRMTTSGVTVLPVVDGQAHYRGVVAREMVRQALAHGLANAPVQTCLQTELYTATPETPLWDIARQLRVRRQRYVPILTGIPPYST